MSMQEFVHLCTRIRLSLVFDVVRLKCEDVFAINVCKVQDEVDVDSLRVEHLSVSQVKRS